MEKIKFTMIGIAGAIGSGISACFGGWDAGLKVLFIFMGLDYLAGLIVAGIFRKSKKTASGGLNSSTGWKGLAKKGGTLLIVFVAAQLDVLMGSTFIRDGVVIAFVLNETISIIENAGLMGVPIPPVLTKAIDLLARKSEEINNGN